MRLLIARYSIARGTRYSLAMLSGTCRRALEDDSAPVRFRTGAFLRDKVAHAWKPPTPGAKFWAALAVIIFSGAIDNYWEGVYNKKVGVSYFA